MVRTKNGFSPIFVVVIIGVIALLVASGKSSLQPKVKGLQLAEGGTSGGGSTSGSSGGSDSGSHSGDSGGSTSGSGSSGSTSGSGGSTGGSDSGGSKSPGPSGSGFSVSGKIGTGGTNKGVEIKNADVEIKSGEVQTVKEKEDENEIENEIEKPEVEKVEIDSTEGALELELKEANTPENKKLGKVGNLKLKVRQGKVEQELEFKAEGEKLIVEEQNIGAETNFPLTFDKATGQLIVTTPNGPRIIRVLPSRASLIAKNAGIQNEIDKIEIQRSSIQGTNEDVVLKLTGKKTGSILGLIDINAPVETEIGAQTGKVININEPFWLKLLSPFIQ